MLRKKWMVIGLVLILNSALLSSEFVEQDGSILLPQQKFFKSVKNHPAQMKLSLSPNWQSFMNENGNWAVQWNEYTGTPHRAFGKSISIKGYSHITEENVKEASLSFIKDYASVLKVNINDLELVRANLVRGKWYVTYKQVKENIDVLFSEVELRIFENVHIMSFGVDFYNNIELSLKPAITLSEAKDKATKYLEFNTSSDKVKSMGKLYILPIKENKITTHHLVYHIEVSVANPIGNYDVFVDAHNGEIIWRHNNIRYIDTKAHVTGDVQLV